MSVEPASDHDNAVRKGWLVFLVLGILTIVEYAIAVNVGPNLPILIGIAAYKAGLILYYFMHVARAWGATEGSE